MTDRLTTIKQLEEEIEYYQGLVHTFSCWKSKNEVAKYEGFVRRRKEEIKKLRNEA